jgi:hypothetical protein
MGFAMMISTLRDGYSKRCAGGDMEKFSKGAIWVVCIGVIASGISCACFT